MENNSVTPGRKAKKTVIFLATFFLVCAAAVGGVFAWNALSGNNKPVDDKPPVDNNPVVDKQEPGKIVLDEEGRPEDGSDITQTETAVDYEKLRELLLADGKFAIELTADVRIDQELTVNGTKKLVGNKSIIMELYAEPFQSVLKVPAGATLILDGVTLDGNGIANGVTVEKGAGFTGLSGKILYPVPYGVITAGAVRIKGITIDESMDTGLCVQESGRAYMEGGTIKNSAQRGIYVVIGGYVNVSNDALIQNCFYAIRSAGTCVMTGGVLRDAANCLVYSSGDFRVDYQGKNADDRLEWYNAAGEAGIRIGGSSTAYINGVYVHDTVGRGIRVVNHNKVEITNCVIEGTGSYGFETWNGHEDAIVTNVEIRNTSASAVRNHGGTAKLLLDNVTVTGTTGFGIKNEVGTVVAQNVKVTDSVRSSIWGDKGSVTHVDGALITGSKEFGVENNSATMTLKNITVTDPARMGFVSKKESVTTIENMTIANAPERGIYNLGGTVTASGIAITSPGNYGVSTAKSDGFAGRVIVSDLTVTGVKERDALNCYDSVLTVTKGTVSDVAQYGARASKGGQLTLTDVEIKDCGLRGVGGMGADITLTNVAVAKPGEFGVTTSKTEEFTGRLSANNLTVTDVRGNALNCNGSVLKVTKGNIYDIEGNGAYAEKGGQLTLMDVEMKDCVKRGIYVRNNGTKASLTDLKIENTGTSSIFLEPGTAVEAERVNIDTSKSYGIFVKSGSFKGQELSISGTTENGFHVTSSDDDGQSVVEVDGLTVVDSGDRGIQNLGGDVTLKNVTITNPGTYGATTSKSGGYNGKLEITDLTLTGVKKNAALNCNESVLTVTKGTISDVEQNGAYVEKGGQFTLTDVEISDCKRRGIFVNNAGTTATLENVKVFNTIMTNIHVVGGAVLNGQNVVVSMDDLAERTEEEREAFYGIYVSGSESAVTIGGDASNITRNIAEGQTPEYSAIRAESGTLTIDGGTYSGLSAKNGGVIFSKRGNVVINGGIFKDNVATNRGGVIYSDKTTTTINGGEFVNNRAEGNIGGGVVGAIGGSELVLTGGYFHDNTASAIPATEEDKDKVYGGGAIESGGTVTITGGIFEGNKAFKGGAIYVDTAGTLNISGGDFLSNATLIGADTAGGVIYNKGDKLAITGGTFGSDEKGNRSYHRGGVLYLAGVKDQTRSATIKDVVFIGNRAAAGRGTAGGVLYVDAGVDAVIENCKFEKNQATYNGTSTTTYSYGGVAYVNGGTMTVTGSEFTGNSASIGGAILVTGANGSLSLGECGFDGNTAKTSGTDVRCNGKSKVYLAGKVKSEIALNDTAMAYAGEALSEGSAIAIRIINTSSINNKERVVVTFADDTVMNDSKSYFSLHSAHAAYRLSFNNSKATIVKASLASGKGMRSEIA